jgi:hypothetical protein
MYTGEVVRLRSFALVLALAIAAAPALSVICEVDCVQPPAVSTACHSASGPGDPLTLRATHSCDHDHASGSPALLTSATGRDSVEPLFTAAGLSVESLVPEPARATAAAMHGPPGPNSRSTISLTTVLRI